MALRAGIVSVGAAWPDRIIANEDLVAMGVDTSDAWIRTRSGIERRRFAAPEDPRQTSDFGAEALNQALERAGWEASDLDAILCTTSTPEQAYPAIACLIQAQVGATRAFGLDLGAACTGFVAALNLASGLVALGQCRKLAIVSTELNSRILDFSDRGTCVLFGDGAGAVLLEAREDGSGVLGSELRSDGRLAEILRAPRIHMEGQAVYRCAVKEMPAIALRVLAQCQVQAQDVALVIPHQANLRIIESTADRLGIPMDRFMVNLQDFGNTSSASIPLALDQALREGRITKGDLVLTVAVGAGMIWGTNLIRW